MPRFPGLDLPGFDILPLKVCSRYCHQLRIAMPLAKTSEGCRIYGIPSIVLERIVSELNPWNPVNSVRLSS